MVTLRTDVEATYGEAGDSADVTEHQQAHDRLHVKYNSLEQFRLGEAYINAEHTVINMMRGSYIPNSDTIVVEVGYSGLMEGVGHFSTFFSWNQSVAAGTDLLTGAGFVSSLGPYIADTEYITVGSAASPGNTGDTRRRFMIEGLTPGVEMVWQVDVGATGYQEDSLYPGDVPVQVALTPDNHTVLVSAYTSGTVRKFRAGNRWEIGGVSELLGEFSVNTAYGLATHPTDNSVFYVGSNGDGEVYEMSVEDGTILRTFTVATPYFLAVSNDGTKLYVGNGGNNITPITLADGTVGSAITVGGFGGQTAFKAIGDYIITPCSSGEQVDRITVADDTITTLDLTGQTPTANGIDAASEDESTFWVLTKEHAEAIEVDTETMQATATPPILDAEIEGTPVGIAVSPTGKSVIIVSTTRQLQTFVIPPKNEVYEEAAFNGATYIITDRFGDLWILNQPEDEFIHFHCGRMEVDPNDPFWGGYADVLIEVAR